MYGTAGLEKRIKFLIRKEKLIQAEISLKFLDYGLEFLNGVNRDKIGYGRSREERG